MGGVLLVDDDEAYLRAFERAWSGRDVLATASSKTEALELSRQFSPELAIVDLYLGGDSGLEVVRELKALHSELRVILVSSYITIDLTMVAIRSGADDVITKPVTPDEIMARLQTKPSAALPAERPSLARVEWDYIQRVLHDVGGNVSEAARRLGIFRSSLQRRLRKHAPKV